MSKTVEITLISEKLKAGAGFRDMFTVDEWLFGDIEEEYMNLREILDSGRWILYTYHKVKFYTCYAPTRLNTRCSMQS